MGKEDAIEEARKQEFDYYRMAEIMTMTGHYERAVLELYKGVCYDPHLSVMRLEQNKRLSKLKITEDYKVLLALLKVREHWQEPIPEYVDK